MILERVRLGGIPWPTLDPFLFCAYHKDDYPEGTDSLGVKGSLAGRNMGSDFSRKDGFSMYHGRSVPGFPSHPHRGFETVTLARRGFIDHSDSLGAKARFGEGDVQWMTAGKGIVHAEMFPLLQPDERNPVELFQIWLNLPARDKMVDPYFTMFWSHQIPGVEEQGVRVTAICGSPDPQLVCPAPPPDSWASRPEAEIAIWTIELEPNARWTLPAASKGLNRALYTVDSGGVTLAGTQCGAKERIRVQSDSSIELVNGPERTELLLLQGRPIGEPVAQHGPFVMNTRVELQQAYDDYQRTRFGGWPWKRNDPVHEREGRFAVHADGTRETP